MTDREPTGAEIDDYIWKDYTIDPTTNKVVHKKTLAGLMWWRNWRLPLGILILLLLTLLLIGGTMFTDVPESLNSYEAIKNLKDEGWIVGVGNNEFKPFDTITRAQMAVLIVRANEGIHFKPTAAVGFIPDVDKSYWAAGWIETAIQTGVMDLYDGNKFYPHNPATRADVAMLLWKAK